MEDVKEGSNPSATEVWEEFKNTTTAHGLPHITKQGGAVRQTFWLMLTLGAVSGLLLNLYNNTQLYLSYPVTVSVNLQHSSQLHFPAVTVCNSCPVRQSAWQLFHSTYSGGSTNSEISGRKRRSTVGCPDGWIMYNNSCYHFSNDTKSYRTAGSWCDGLGADLVIITSSYEEAFVETHLDTGARYWIGLSNKVGVWYWADGTRAFSTNWEVMSNQPDESGRCAIMTFEQTDDEYYSGAMRDNEYQKWEVASCDSIHGFICEYKSAHLQSNCPESEIWKMSLMGQWQSSCYYLDGSLYLNFTDARRHCKIVDGQNSELVIIETTEEQEFLYSTIGLTTKSSWIGLFRYQWSDGSSALDYNNWNSSIPTPGDGVALTFTNHSNRPSWKWTEADYSSYYRFVCEKPVSGAGRNLSPGKIHPPAEFTEPYITSDATKHTETTTTMPSELSQASPTILSPQYSDPNSYSCCTVTCCNYTQEGVPASCSVCNNGNDEEFCHSVNVNPYIPSSRNITTNSTKTPSSVPGSVHTDRKPWTEQFVSAEHMTELTAQLPNSDKNKLGFSYDSLILECEFSGSFCDESAFEQFWNPIHGNCYTFNSGWNGSQPILISHRTGKRRGLHLTVNIDQEEYISDSAEAGGAWVVVHDQNTMPFPEEEGILISPGLITYIGLSKVTVQRLASPHGECVSSDIVNHTRNIYEQQYNVTYSAKGCLKTCYQRAVIETCQCADSNYQVAGIFPDKNINMCRTNNITEDDCRYGIEQMFEGNELACDCPPQCKQVSFETDMCSGQWPTDVHKVEILQSLYPKVESLFSNPSDPEKYKRNLLKLVVYYDQFSQKIIQEQPAYELTGYVSDWGGVLGLWLGCSAFSICEYLELGVDLLVVLFWKLFARKKPGNQMSSHNSLAADEADQTEIINGTANHIYLTEVPNQELSSFHGDDTITQQNNLDGVRELKKQDDHCCLTPIDMV